MHYHMLNHSAGLSVHTWYSLSTDLKVGLQYVNSDEQQPAVSRSSYC
jgi:hypothetical protein